MRRISFGVLATLLVALSCSDDDDDGSGSTAGNAGRAGGGSGGGNVAGSVSQGGGGKGSMAGSSGAGGVMAPLGGAGGMDGAGGEPVGGAAPQGGADGMGGEGGAPSVGDAGAAGMTAEGGQGGAPAGEPFDSITVAPMNLEISGVTTVAQVVSSAPGWIVLAQGACSSAGAQRGVLGVPAATTNSASIEAAAPLTTGTYCARLHHEGANAGGFNAGDDPQATEQGNPVQADWTITVPAGIPDIRVTVSPSGFTAWRVTGVLPSIRRSDVTAASAAIDDPALTLIRGLRYEFVGYASIHPLVFVQASGTQVSNGNCVGAHAQVLLSTGGGDADVSATATLEADAEVAWVDNPAPTYLRMTIDTTLGAVTDVRYRCGNHEDMCGSIGFVDP